jgi:uncharacterized membrane protein
LGGPGSPAPGFSSLRFDGLRPGGIARLLGKLPTWMALLLLAGGAALGVIVTLIAGQEPGDLLGVFVILGSIAAALAIKRGKVYLIFPAPALTFFVAAILAGKVHDAKLGSSTAGLASGFTQWTAGIFIPAVVATIIVLVIGGLRWMFDHQLITGRSPLSAGRPLPGKARPAPGSRDSAIDDWADDNPFADSAPRSGQTGPTPRQDRPSWTGNQGSNRRTDRDPWGDPRSPADRKQPTGRPNQSTGPRPNQGTSPRPNQGTSPRPNQGTSPRPNQGTSPRPNQGTSPRPNQGTSPRPNQGTAPRPNQGTSPRPNQGTSPRPRPNGQPQPRTPRPSFNPSPNPAPAPNPQRPRRQPPEGWTGR